MESDGSKYTFTFYNQRLRATVDRLDPVRSTIKAALLIETLEKHAVLYDGAWELTSALYTRRLVDLAEKIAPGLPWGNIFDAISRHTIDHYETGNPWVCLADMPPPSETVEYLIKPILESGTTTLLFADGGSGKSWLATAISTMVATGRPMGGLIAGQGPTNVAYLDWESSEEVYWRRVNGLCGSMGVPIPQTVFYRQLSGRLTSFTRDVKTWCQSQEIGLIVIDSAALAAGEAETSADATRLFEAIREIDVTALVVAHVPKADASRPFGSVFMRNGPRSVWKLERDSESDGALTIAARHVKSNNTALQAPLGWQFTFRDDGRTVDFQPTDPNVIAEIEATRPVKHRIAEILGIQGAMWATEIAEQLGLGMQVASVTLRRGLDKAFVKVEVRGKQIKWGLLAHVEANDHSL